MKIGTLAILGAGMPDEMIEGHVRTLKFRADFKLRAITTGPQSENAPTHEIWAKVHGDFVPLGLAWRKKITRGDKIGKAFYQLSFDDPSFDAPLYVSAFPFDDEDAFEIVWNRPKLAKDQAA